MQKLMFLLLKIFWSLDITAVAVAILTRISAVQEPSLDNVAPSSVVFGGLF